MENKPGWKTTEFWVSLSGMIVGGLLASGIFADGGTWATILGGILAALSGMGYTAARTITKSNEAKAAAEVEAAKVSSTKAAIKKTTKRKNN